MVGPLDSVNPLPEICATPKKNIFQRLLRLLFAPKSSLEYRLHIVNSVGESFHFEGVEIKNKDAPPEGHIAIMARRNGKMVAIAVSAEHIAQFLERSCDDKAVNYSDAVRAQAKAKADVVELKIAENVKDICNHVETLEAADVEKTMRIAYRLLGQEKVRHAKKSAQQPYSISICRDLEGEFEAVIHLPGQELGRGGVKKVKKVYAVTRSCFEARGGLLDVKRTRHRELLKEEISYMTRLKGCRGIIDIHIAYDPKDPGGKKKPGFMMECYDDDLFNLTGSEATHLPTRRDFVGIFDDVAQGMLAAHERGIVNSDIKPENILVKRDQDGSLKGVLSDFGYAIDLSAIDTDDFIIRGTPDYYPPETNDSAMKKALANIKKKRGITDDAEAMRELYKARDVFSLGVTILRSCDTNFKREFSGYSNQVFSRFTSEKALRGAFRYDARNTDPMYQLAWKMIRMSPHERPTAQEVALELARIRALT